MRKNGAHSTGEAEVWPFKFDSIRVPILNTVGAGRSVADLPSSEWREIRSIKGARPWDQYCAARVSGDSLSDEGIRDGDYVIIRMNFEAYEIRPGRLAAVWTPYGLLLKRVFTGLNGHVRLVSANPLYEDIVLPAEELTIQGVVIRLERDL